MNSGNLRRAKIRRRLSLIAANSVHNLLLPVLNIFISLLVIRFASNKLWGEFVYILIVVTLTTHILQWGNKDYLLREFSFNPGSVMALWQKGLLSRLPLLLLFIPFAVFLHLQLEIKLLLILWVFFAFVFQSFDVVIIFKQRFKTALFLDVVVTSILIICIIILRNSLNRNLLILLFTLQFLLKMIALGFVFRKDLLGKFLGRIEPAFIMMALPFFMVGFSGMLTSRMDLYCVAYFLSDNEVGQYQVLINMLLYLQGIASFIITPFIKYVYRFPAKTIKKTLYLMSAIGIVINTPAIAAVYFIISYYYRFVFSPEMFFIAYLFIIPVYFYIVKVQMLFRNHQQKVVVLLCFFYAVINLVLNVFLIPSWGIKGALISGAIVQWLLLLSYFISERRLNKGESL
jgi:O-antigen/teichoic acid export membrane protein